MEGYIFIILGFAVLGFILLLMALVVIWMVKILVGLYRAFSQLHTEILESKG